MHASFATLLSLVTFLCGPAAVLAEYNNTGLEPTAVCSATEISARLPPSLSSDGQNVSTYESMPAGWLHGNWKITYTSQPAYFSMQNMQWDVSPVFPQSDNLPGQNNDLTSYQSPNSTTVQTIYGVDTPRRSSNKTAGQEWDDVYDFVGSGNLSTNLSIEIVAWGYDTTCDPYVVIHETPASTGASADIVIGSRRDTGPTNATLTRIFNALLALNNTEVTGSVNGTVPLVQNGGRNSTGPAVCDAACVNNTNTAP